MANEVLEYIYDHIRDLREEMDDSTDHADMIWFEGAIEALEHVVAKFEED